MTKNKYGNKKTFRIIGKERYEFDSLKEAKRFDELYLLLKAKKISDLKLQPEFILADTQYNNGKTYPKVKYISDFKYIKNEKTVVEDVKGMRTTQYIIKAKWFLSLYGDRLIFKEI